MKAQLVLLALTVPLVAGCGQGTEQTSTALAPRLTAPADSASSSRTTAHIGAELLRTEDTEVMWQSAGELASRGRDSIPVFLSALTNSIAADRRWSVVESGRIGVCVEALHGLAQKGIWTEQEVQALLLVIRRQTDMAQTFATAETLRLITGVDPGYSREFIASYQETHESVRQAKIDAWEDWLKQRHLPPSSP
jgi:hypothetical protein